MNQSMFEAIKYNIVFVGAISRHIRMARARIVYMGSDLEDNARWLVMRTMDAMNTTRLSERFEYSDLSEAQQSELVSLAKDTLGQFTPLTEERARGMTGSQIHGILS